MRDGPDMKRVLITRAQPAAHRTARNVKAAGFEPVEMPLFEVHDLGVALPDERFDGVIFTSSNAANVMAARHFKVGDRYSTAYCVGKRTAEAVRDLGFQSIVCADGDAARLAERICNVVSDRPLRLLYLAARDRSFDIGSVLAEAGIEMVEVMLYEVKPCHPDAQVLEDVRRWIRGGFVLGYSRQSALHTATVLWEDIGTPSDLKVSLVAISQSVAQTVLKYPWQDVYVAHEPNEKAMLERLERV